MLEKIPSAVGAALAGIRPGLDKTVAAQHFAAAPDTLTVSSPRFVDGGALPADVTEDGRKVSPPLSWSGGPPGAAEVVLVVEDADSPTPAPLVHCLAWDLPPVGDLVEGELGGDGPVAQQGDLGKNSFFKTGWLPPDPPSGHGPHRYVFQVFALEAPSGLQARAGRGELVAALNGKVVAKGLLIGTYERQ